MKKLYQFHPILPYSLHDMRICSMETKNENLHFVFENGYVKIGEPCKRVDGTMTIEHIDRDFCNVFLLSKNGRSGKFQGQKMTFSEFLDKYDLFCFEIVDELHGYHQVCYVGFISLPDYNHLIEMHLTVYFNGSIVYETSEKE